MQSLETQLNEALAAIQQRDELIASLKKVIHTKTITIAGIQRDWQLKEAKLPGEVIQKLHAAFATSLDNAGLRQAINAEKRLANGN